MIPSGIPCYQGLAFCRVLCYNHGSACPCRGPVHQSREDAVADSLPLPEGLALDTASWEHTPLVVQHVVGQLLAIIQQQTARIQALEARMADLEARVQQRSPIPIVLPPPILRMRNGPRGRAPTANRAPSPGTPAISKPCWPPRRSSRSSPRPAPVGRPSVWTPVPTLPTR